MKEDNIVKLRKKRTPKIGIIIFLLIFVYMIINIVLYYQKDHMSIYEVQSEDLADDKVFGGVIIRDEEVVKTSGSGYVNTFALDNSRVSKGMMVYSLSDTKSYIDDYVIEASSAKDPDSIKAIKSVIATEREAFELSDYQSLLEFKAEVLSKYNEQSELEAYNKINNAGSENDGYIRAVSSCSGVVSYDSDSLAGIDIDDITADTFEKYNYSRFSLRTAERCGEGTSVYRIVKSENWKIVLLVDEEYYIANLETKKVKGVIENDNFEFTAPVTFEKHDDMYFAVIELSDFMVRYIDERFLNVEIIGDEVQGLKIPLSSITNKEFYVVPDEYLYYDDSTRKNYVLVMTYNENSKTDIPVERELTVYYDDGTYSYIEGVYIDAGVYIKKQHSDEKYRIAQIERLEGVYNVNRGYAVFRRIERIRENDSYCIIEKNTKYGLSQYDHIALIADTVKESAIIY